MECQGIAEDEGGKGSVVGYFLSACTLHGLESSDTFPVILRESQVLSVEAITQVLMFSMKKEFQSTLVSLYGMVLCGVYCSTIIVAN